MKRTTVMLPYELHAKACFVARERGISFGELVRKSVERATERKPARRKGWKDDPLFANFKPFEGKGPTDVAARHDDYLYGDEA
ncbi:MAG: hypothetical protein AAB215_02150 [Planctomycetota bacterium]